ncbi:extracellular solute-binding protein [Paenibacillus sp. sptzw28]|uniref:ABC transporter substrate-binding protein n=1 Tax=Paenibacillus sp. sptzw28 TaxID=715179 RepID=UPI001C6E9EF6|nr:extracellular solute-binding protein [Paenibacillus sp. sptzw28]QYR21113.1 extracellular solute-binding protein [Paenibacillus sp. sptzw28]
MNIRIFAIFLCLCVLLGGCQSENLVEEKKEITILYSSTADFYKDYGFVIDKFKDIEFRVVEFTPQLGKGVWKAMKYVPASNKDWDSELYLKLVRDTKPDILFFPSSIYSSLLNQNMLTDVSQYVNEGNFNGINSNITEAIKEMGNGSLYALADTTSSQALFYNKEVFEKYGISEPTNQMTWESVLELAERFPSDGKITGLYLPFYDAADLLLVMGKAEGLKWYDSLNKTVLFDNPSWRTILDKTITFYKHGSGNSGDDVLSELFMNGQIAMTLNTYHFTKELERSTKKVNWQVVSEPVDPNNPGVSHTINFQYLNGIYVETDDTENSQAIWSYINSEEAARLKNNLASSLFTQPVRESLISDDDNRNYKAFYQLKPKVLNELNRIPLSIENAVLGAINNILQPAINNELTIDQVVQKLQEDIQNVIQANNP